MNEVQGPSTAPWTLVYDGECRFCGACVRLVRRWDRWSRIEVVPLQDTGDVPTGLPLIPRDELEAAMHLVAPDGRVWVGAAAAPPLLRLLPGGALLAAVFRLPGVPALAARAYAVIARHRHRLGCGSAVCARGR